MKRQFKGETCVYCQLTPAASDDHIFSRKFFSVRHRADLPKAPACDRCNNQKAQLETYLTAVLPMGSRLSGGIDQDVPRRLANNLKLVRELTQENEPGSSTFSDGLVGIRTAFRFRYHQLDEYLCMAATALAWHHFGTRLADDYAAAFFDFDAKQAQVIDQLFDLNGAKRAAADLGEGTVLYRGIQAIDDVMLSTWQFRLFGGLRLGSSDLARTGDVASEFVVLIGRRSLLEGIRTDQAAATSIAAPAPS